MSSTKTSQTSHHATATSPQTQARYADPDSLRTAFTLAMSAMYKDEVPLYGDLVRIVSQVNSSTIASTSIDSRVLSMRYGDAVGPSSRIDIERHGAIRLGTAQELRTIRRVFAIIGLYPVGYYDLSPAGLPMHATCFRPKDRESLRRNPFRVFTSVLRPELLQDKSRALALELLSKRNIFTDELMRLLDLADAQNGQLTVDQSERFIPAAMETFKWHGTAASSYGDYQTLKVEHPILADIACFRSAHINHLTPRTLDIISAQETMKTEGLQVKERIEGPPSRMCPILLRQTSFLAIQEPIRFLTNESVNRVDGALEGSHRARFGEIEERGAAVTPAGRTLYDDLLSEAMNATQSSGGVLTAETLDEEVERAFAKYPDTWDELRKQGLVYCSYRCTAKAGTSKPIDGPYTTDELLQGGWVESVPITYEDFLPLSAAGIFQSNLGAKSAKGLDAAPDVRAMEDALQVKLGDPDELYRKVRADSIQQCAMELGIIIQR